MEVFFKGNNQSLQEIVSAAFEAKKQTLFDKIFKKIPFALILGGLAIDAEKRIADVSSSNMVNASLNESTIVKTYAYTGGIVLLVALYFKRIAISYYRSLGASNGTLTQKQKADLKLERLCLLIGSITGIYLRPENFRDLLMLEYDYNEKRYLIPNTFDYCLREIHVKNGYQISLITNHKK